MDTSSKRFHKFQSAGWSKAARKKAVATLKKTLARKRAEKARRAFLPKGVMHVPLDAVPKPAAKKKSAGGKTLPHTRGGHDVDLLAGIITAVYNRVRGKS